MVAYSFQKRFVAPILDGTKCQTIRANRRRHARPGERVQLFTGMRTKHCKRIANGTCRAVTPIELSFIEDQIVLGKRFIFESSSLNQFARSDGFEDWPDMKSFWKMEDGGMFFGFVIEWFDLEAL